MIRGCLDLSPQTRDYGFPIAQAPCPEDPETPAGLHRHHQQDPFIGGISTFAKRSIRGRRFAPSSSVRNSYTPARRSTGGSPGIRSPCWPPARWKPRDGRLVNPNRGSAPGLARPSVPGGGLQPEAEGIRVATLSVARESCLPRQGRFGSSLVPARCRARAAWPPPAEERPGVRTSARTHRSRLAGRARSIVP